MSSSTEKLDGIPQEWLEGMGTSYMWRAPVPHFQLEIYSTSILMKVGVITTETS